MTATYTKLFKKTPLFFQGPFQVDSESFAYTVYFIVAKLFEIDCEEVGRELHFMDHVNLFSEDIENIYKLRYLDFHVYTDGEFNMGKFINQLKEARDKCKKKITKFAIAIGCSNNNRLTVYYD